MKSLEVIVDRRTRRVRVGDNVEERITIRNLSRLPKPTLEVEDLTDLPGYSSGMAVSLPQKGFRSWRTQAPARTRGVYTLGPVRVSNTDAFGMFRRESFFCDTDQLIVYPRTHYIPEFAIPAADLSGDSSTRAALARPDAACVECAGVCFRRQHQQDSLGQHGQGWAG